MANNIYNIPPVWTGRWNNLKKQMNTMGSDFRFWKGRGVPRMQALEVCVESLKIFAQKQKDFFENEFNSDLEKNGVLNKQFSDHYVFSTIFDQVGFDLQVMHQAANQRAHGTKSMKDALHIADKLAHAALSPIKLTRNIAMITYITKSTSIRVIPYADVAFIGIPFTCIPNPSPSPAKLSLPDLFSAQDYLAIPHELGHFLFWYGRIDGKYIHEIYRAMYKDANEKDQQYYRWSEEIFADVYGCLIADAVIALDFQDLQSRKSQDDFVKDDGEHPPPIIRPDIYTRVLHRRGSSLVTELNDKWKEKRERIDRIKKENQYQMEAHIGKDKIPTPILDIGTPIPVDQDGEKPVNKIVDETFEMLAPRIKRNKIKWWLDNLHEMSVNDLYQAFANKINNESINNLDAPKEPELEDIITEKKVNNLQIEWKKIESEYKQAPEWLTVLSARGWTTKGPDCDGTGGVC